MPFFFSFLFPLHAQDSRAETKLAPVALVEGTLKLVASWAAIADSTYRLHEKHPEYFTLEPVEKSKRWDFAAFAPLLPREAVGIGDTWRVPPTCYGPLLKQFHPGLRTAGKGVGMRVPGGYACLRALSHRYAEIALRVHVDYVLEPNRAHFAPAQFAGHVIVDREKRTIVAFRMALPPRNSNVDILAREPGKPYMAADIVYVPKMELSGGARPEGLAWAREISEAEARKRLAKCFYRCVDIDWIPFARVREEAFRTKKAMHLMVLFGTLDDESC